MLVYGYADPIWPSELNQSRVRSARMAEQFPCRAVTRFDEMIQTLMLPARPMDHHERIALQGGPEADRRNPRINV